MSVLIEVVVVLFRVLDLLGRHSCGSALRGGTSRNWEGQRGWKGSWALAKTAVRVLCTCLRCRKQSATRRCGFDWFKGAVGCRKRTMDFVRNYLSDRGNRFSKRKISKFNLQTETPAGQAGAETKV